MVDVSATVFFTAGNLHRSTAMSNTLIQDRSTDLHTHAVKATRSQKVDVITFTETRERNLRSNLFIRNPSIPPFRLRTRMRNSSDASECARSKRPRQTSRSKTARN